MDLFDVFSPAHHEDMSAAAPADHANIFTVPASVDLPAAPALQQLGGAAALETTGADDSATDGQEDLSAIGQALDVLHEQFDFELPFASYDTEIEYGLFDEAELIALLERILGLSPEERIKQLSALFLGTPYLADRLVGGPDEPERLIADFSGLDCFTYLDYVEALRLSETLDEFIENLVNTRYKDGEVDFFKRKHFFSDWVSGDNDTVRDITDELSPHSEKVVKSLNERADGETFIPDLEVQEREIDYIPSEYIDECLMSNLQTGDYIGIFTNIDGLDVTHTGIFIRDEDGNCFFRHASSTSDNDAVVDTPFLEYMASVPGIMVYRPM